jgi:rhodanese-related sulfurtransferase
MDISAAEFSTHYQDPDSFVIIDVREELEFQTFNIGGYNIPLGQLSAGQEELDFGKDREIVVICQRGLRSATATKILGQQGFTNVRNLAGGLLALQKLQHKSFNTKA